ncbi:hypothetical protein ABBQ32_013315 [Trebouxia sp. C0010 RCD-2024]
MAHRSNSTSFSTHGNEQDKRKKGIFSKVFGSGNGGSRYSEEVQNPYSNQRAQAYSATSSSTRSEAPSHGNVNDNLRAYERVLEPRRSFTVQAAMQEVAQPDALAQPVYADNDQASTAASSVNTVPTSSVTDGLPPPAPIIPQMSAWRQAQELTRKAEEEAMLAEKKSQEAYVCATEAAAAQKEAEEAHEQYDRSKGQLRILEEEQLRAEEAREQVEQSTQALAAKEAEMAALQTQAEKAAEIARDKYDEAKGQRELAEQKTAEHKRTEAEHLTIQQRLHDAGAQLASISTEVEQQVSALSETQAARQQQSGRLQEAEAEVERIARELAEAQAVADQLRQDADAIMKEEEEQEALLNAKQEQERMHITFLETTKMQLGDLHSRRDAVALEAQQCQAAIRGKADIAKQERENALSCKAAVDNALAEIEGHREAHRQKERDWQIQTQASNQAAEQIPSMREEAEMRAKQTNQKYDEAEQKSQAWMKAKDEAQSHKRMWHSYWQQAMVSFSLHVVPVLQVLPVYVLCTCKDLVLAKRIPIATSRLWLLPCQQRTLKQFCRTNKPTFAILAAAPSICYALL